MKNMETVTKQLLLGCYEIYLTIREMSENPVFFVWGSFEQFSQIKWQE